MEYINAKIQMQLPTKHHVTTGKAPGQGDARQTEGTCLSSPGPGVYAQWPRKCLKSIWRIRLNANKAFDRASKHVQALR